LFTDGILGGYIVLLVRFLLAAVFGSINSILYSLPSGLISYTIQVVLVKLLMTKLSVVSISVIGGVLHNLMQTLIATLITGVNLYSLVIYTLPAGFIAGLFVGIVAYLILKRLPDKFYGK
jgi:heptaprenyl diphosphate synthase